MTAIIAQMFKKVKGEFPASPRQRWFRRLLRRFFVKKMGETKGNAIKRKETKVDRRAKYCFGVMNIEQALKRRTENNETPVGLNTWSPGGTSFVERQTSVRRCLWPVIIVTNTPPDTP
ncbi:MAG: hypothetical protein ACYDBJ_06970 [Aggregatilineales bacterium]